MGGAPIDDQENRALGAGHQALEKLDEDRGIHPSFSDHEPHMAARVIAEIRLMRWRAPVVSTMGVASR